MIPQDDTLRKEINLTYQWRLFPRATLALSKHIKFGADKHCGGIIKWNREKSPDDIGSLLRHLFEFVLHPTEEGARAIVWRAMALCEKFLEQDTRGSEES